uniref:SPRY domain-containing protein n=1 Tax=Meloidogyne hapla TaxID=6305 RepID=A0A1I8BYZ7_MELHA
MTITSFEKKIGELTIEMVKLNNLNNKQVNFVEIKNKWSKISENVECCENKCINTNKPVGNCIKGNGFINLINDENIKYIKGKGIDNCGRVYAENSFKNPKEDSSINYSLFYFEIKCTKILEKNGLIIGLKNKNYNYISFYVYKDLIKNENSEEFKLSSFSWNNNDIFGCGLIYPPNGINELPYSFFTQNGKEIGKAVLLNDNCRSYLPFITLNGCDVETNFGNDLEVKPFIYDIKKHFLAKQFY